MSIFMAAVLAVIAYILAKYCRYRKDKLESDKRGSFKKLKESAQNEAPQPHFGEQKEYLYQEGSLRSLDTKSHSSLQPTKGSEELRKIRIGKFEFTPTYYHDRVRLQIVIRRVTCYPVYQNLQNAAYLYIVACLLPDRKDFFESDLQQIDEDNMVDEMCEFEIQYSEIENRILLFEVHVCDRFSRHQIIDEFRYKVLTRQENKKEKTIEKLDYEECARASKEVSCFNSIQ